VAVVYSIEASTLVMLGLVLYHWWGKRLFLRWRIVTPQNWRQFGLAHVPTMTLLGALGASAILMTLTALCLMVAFESPVLEAMYRLSDSATRWQAQVPEFPPVVTNLQSLTPEQQDYLLHLLDGQGYKREVFALRLSGVPLAEVAQRLNLSLHTVKDYQRRACRYLEEQHPGLKFTLGRSKYPLRT